MRESSATQTSVEQTPVVAEPRRPGAPSTRLFVLTLATIVAIGLSIAFVDAPVAAWVRGHHFAAGTKLLFRVARLPGDLLFTAVAVLLLAIVRRRPWRDAAAIVGVGAIASLLAGLMKIACGRRRPSAAHDPGAWLSLAHRAAADFLPGNLSFPSGDSALAFATAATVAHVWPRAATPAFAWATLVAVTRVLQGVHHPSDVLAGALLGTLSATFAIRFAPRFFPTWDGSACRVLRHVPAHASVEGRAL